MTQTGQLLASDGATFNSASISGDTAVCGSFGGIYVFVRPTTGWTTMTETARLTASGGSPIVIRGDTIVAIATPRAFVYVKPKGGWVNTSTANAVLTASDGQQGDGFGQALGLSDDTVVVGAYTANIGGNDHQGAAYVFAKPESGWTNMTQTAKLVASDGKALDQFGSGAAIASGTIVVGANQAQSPGEFGASYVFVKGATGWKNMTQTAKLVPAGGLTQHFGNSLTISRDGSWIIPSDFAWNYTQGAIYMYREPGGGWVNSSRQNKMVTGPNGQGEFGVVVATDDSNIAVSAPYTANGGTIFIYGDALGEH
jgi:hypothetical protein